MKLKHLIWGALPLLIAGCSSDNLDGSPDGPKTPEESLKAGYFAVRIDLPTVPSTKADDPGVNFDDGSENEYNVQDIGLIIFKKPIDKTAESDATFVKAWDISGMIETPDYDNDNLTSSYQKAVKINEGDLSGDLYALAVLNYKDVMTISDGALTVNGTPVETSTTFETFNEMYVTAATASGEKFYGSKDSKGYFFMTNAPVFNKQGGTVEPAGGAVSILAKLENTTTYTTDTEALNNPACAINVERAVAKITSAWEPTELTLKEASTAEDGTSTAAVKLYAKTIKWKLVNTAKDSYIVRNVDGSGNWWSLYSEACTTTDKYRFVGGNAIGTTLIQPVQTLYRTYWCKDLHYSDAYSGANFLDESAFADIKDNAPKYCYENTFNVANQNYQNTTIALFEVEYALTENGTPQDFYINEAESDVIYVLSTAQDKVLEKIVEQYKDIIEAEIKECLADGNQDYTFTKNDMVVDFTVVTSGDAAGKCKITISLKDFKDDVIDENNPETADRKFKKKPELSDALKNTFESYANSMFSFTKYADGVSYYFLPIKHFGDALTPWTAGDGNQTSTDKAYGSDSDAKYLGRYGLVRNNWYDIVIEDVKKLGDATVPDLKVDTSDDNNKVEQKIAFRINMLSWAKRTQTHTFK